jgi:hypothetical protein
MLALTPLTLARLTLAGGVTPDNTPHGYNLTFAIPIALFAAVAVTLYLLLGRPHRRIPAYRGTPAAGAAAPHPDSARSAAVAGGLSLAAGGGHVESHLEPAGPAYAPAGGPEPGGPEPGGPEPGEGGPAAGAGAEGEAGPGAPAGDGR